MILGFYIVQQSDKHVFLASKRESPETLGRKHAGGFFGFKPFGSHNWLVTAIPFIPIYFGSVKTNKIHGTGMHLPSFTYLPT